MDIIYKSVILHFSHVLEDGLLTQKKVNIENSS